MVRWTVVGIGLLVSAGCGGLQDVDQRVPIEDRLPSYVEDSIRIAANEELTGRHDPERNACLCDAEGAEAMIADVVRTVNSVGFHEELEDYDRPLWSRPRGGRRTGASVSSLLTGNEVPVFDGAMLICTDTAGGASASNRLGEEGRIYLRSGEWFHWRERPLGHRARAVATVAHELTHTWATTEHRDTVHKDKPLWMFFARLFRHHTISYTVGTLAGCEYLRANDGLGECSFDECVDYINPNAPAPSPSRYQEIVDGAACS